MVGIGSTEVAQAVQTLCRRYKGFADGEGALQRIWRRRSSHADAADVVQMSRSCRWQKGRADGDEAVQMAKRPCRWQRGCADVVDDGTIEW